MSSSKEEICKSRLRIYDYFPIFCFFVINHQSIVFNLRNTVRPISYICIYIYIFLRFCFNITKMNFIEIHVPNCVVRCQTLFSIYNKKEKFKFYNFKLTTFSILVYINIYKYIILFVLSQNRYRTRMLK